MGVRLAEGDRDGARLTRRQRRSHRPPRRALRPSRKAHCSTLSQTHMDAIAP